MFSPASGCESKLARGASAPDIHVDLGGLHKRKCVFQSKCIFDITKDIGTLPNKLGVLEQKPPVLKQVVRQHSRFLFAWPCESPRLPPWRFQATQSAPPQLSALFDQVQPGAPDRRANTLFLSRSALLRKRRTRLLRVPIRELRLAC